MYGTSIYEPKTKHTIPMIKETFETPKAFCYNGNLKVPISEGLSLWVTEEDREDSPYHGSWEPSRRNNFGRNNFWANLFNGIQLRYEQKRAPSDDGKVSYAKAELTYIGPKSTPWNKENNLKRIRAVLEENGLAKIAEEEFRKEV